MLEDFLKLLKGEKPDGVVWTADISYWINGQKQAGTADAAWETEAGYLQLHKHLGVMPYFDYDKFWTGRAVYDNTVEVRRESRDGNTINRMVTPVGTLTESLTYMPESACEAITQHMIATPGDMDVLLYILEHRHLEPCNLEGYAERSARYANYDGLPCLGLPRSPLSSLCYEWAGLQNMVYLMLDCEDKVLTALDIMAAEQQVILDAVCELAPPLVHFPDNLSSDNLTSYYDAHMRDGHRRRIQQLHRAGTRCAVHLDGTTQGLLPKLVESGFDAIEALTPVPAGDLTAAEMQDCAGSDTVILWGGAPGALFAPPYRWNDMERHVQKVLETWKDRPFVLGVADQVPPDGDISFCRKIADMLK